MSTFPTKPADLTQDETTLVNAARSDPAAFAVLYRLHYRTIVAYLYRRTGDAHAAEDLACETFLAAYRAIPNYRLRGLPFRSWLYRIATNAASTWARARSRLRVVPLVSADPCPAPSAAEPALTQEEAQAALLKLAPIHQDVLTLHYLEEIPISEVAAILSLREGTVKSRLARAREALREALENRRTRP